MKVYTKALLFTAMLLIAAGCKKDESPVAPKASADVKKYVSIGNSLTAGYQSGGLYKSAQTYSFPALIAQQLTSAGATIGTFQIPYWDDPGSYGTDGKSSRLVLKSLTGPVIVTEGLAPGAESNISLTRPYDNLGIPGAVVYDFLDTTNFITKSGARANPFFGHVLRSNSSFGASVFKQAKALNPDLVSFWLGNNDVLGYATSGGTSVSPFSGSATPTPSAVFTAMYNAALDSLHAALPNAKIVVANIPDVRAVPYFTTVGPVIGATLAAKGGLKLYYQKHGETGPGSGSSALSGSANDPFIVLTASAIAGYIGDTTGAYYTATKTTPGTGINTHYPFGVHPYNPFPDMFVLDSLEQAVSASAITSFNATIALAASRDNAALVDINTIFNGIKANGITVGGTKYTTDFITGQLFSLDGVHPSDKGQGIVANEFIKAINSKFSFSIAQVDISSLPGISVTPLAKYVVNSRDGMNKSLDSWKSFLKLWQN